MQPGPVQPNPIYHEMSPAAPLSGFVRRIWSLDLPGGAAERIVPDGCCEIVLTLEGQVLGGDREGLLGLRPEAILVGQMSRATLVRPHGRVRLVGIRLHPWAAAEFLRCWPADFNDQVVDLRLACPALWDRLQAADTIASVAAALQTYTAGIASPQPAVVQAVHVIQADPTATVRDLTRRLGWSERSLQRMFAADVGIGPKTLARIVRVQRAIGLANAQPEWTWAGIAASCGYTDQAHLVREFNALAGCTPTSLRAEPQPLRDRLLLRD